MAAAPPPSSDPDTHAHANIHVHADDADADNIFPRYLPADDDGPDEVQRYIVSVLTSPTSPASLTHPAARTLASQYRCLNGLDLKTASVGELQAALGPQHGAHVFQAVDSHMPQLSAVAASVKKAARGWGIEILGDREQSESCPASVAASRVASRVGSRVGSRRGSVDVDEDAGGFLGVGGLGHGGAHGHGHGGLGAGLGSHLERLEEWDGERERDGRWGGGASGEEEEEVLRGSGREGAAVAGGEGAPGLVHRKRGAAGAVVEEE